MNVRVDRSEHDLAEAMRAASRGDAAAYTRLLRDVAEWLRPIIRRELVRSGRSGADAEDIVQDTLLALHLKRHTWDEARPIGPWIRAIARHKLIDTLRLPRGRGNDVSIDEFGDLLVADEPARPALERDVERRLDALPPGQRQVIQAIAIDGLSIGEAAAKFSMTAVAVRVALHRALKSLNSTAGVT
ncbi:sigma-70 family RNA polymerase sigma factor [Rhodoplanes sp. SY1]|uniref:sigma-70 family RNA polymerase sigma factor n=1 Tax=Rhodoplanes sp. SY1 TaxID=3166646 RepID=UPI0038B46AA7